ncbi:unnamed protein product [Urochloa humidicola]
MINTTSEIWEEIKGEDQRLGKYEKKSFPLYDSLDLLYEGQLAEGKHCFTSSKPRHTPSKGSEGGTAHKTLDFRKSNPWTTAIDVRSHPLVCNDEAMDSPPRPEDFGISNLENEHVPYKGLKKRSHRMLERSETQGMETEQNNDSDNDVEDAGHQSDEDTGSRSVTAGSNRGRPKKSQDRKPVPRIEESLSEFVSFRKEQAAAKEMIKRQGEEFSVTRCLMVLKDMNDVSDEIKIGASDVFKDELNRQMFLGYESRLRGLWLKREVSKLGIQPTASKLWFSNSFP